MTLKLELKDVRLVQAKLLSTLYRVEALIFNRFPYERDILLPMILLMTLEDLEAVLSVLPSDGVPRDDLLQSVENVLKRLGKKPEDDKKD